MPKQRNYDLSHWGELPLVSCQCITYGRTHLLDEAVESFLRQDYAGPKELVILNDYEGLMLECDVPGVRVINLPYRMKTIGEKRNACVALCKGTVIFVWDDDDISLPHRISHSLARMKDHRYYKPQFSWFWTEGAIERKPMANVTHPMGAWSTAFFDEVGGYPHVQSGQDLGIENRFIAHNRTIDHMITAEDLYYIYRHGTTGSYHLSQWGAGEGFQQAEQYIKSKNISGTYKISPRWAQDYPAMVDDVMAKRAAAGYSPTQILAQLPEYN